MGTLADIVSLLLAIIEAGPSAEPHTTNNKGLTLLMAVTRHAKIVKTKLISIMSGYIVLIKQTQEMTLSSRRYCYTSIHMMIKV